MLLKDSSSFWDLEFIQFYAEATPGESGSNDTGIKTNPGDLNCQLLKKESLRILKNLHAEITVKFRPIKKVTYII